MFLSTREKELLFGADPQIIAGNLEKLGWKKINQLDALTVWRREKPDKKVQNILLSLDKTYLGYNAHLLRVLEDFCTFEDISTFSAVIVLTDGRDHTDTSVAPRNTMLFFYFDDVEGPWLGLIDTDGLPKLVTPAFEFMPPDDEVLEQWGSGYDFAETIDQYIDINPDLISVVSPPKKWRLTKWVVPMELPYART